MASKERFIAAGRRNRLDEARLNTKLEYYDRDKVKTRFNINEQMKHLLLDIEGTRRTTGHSKEAHRPADRGDSAYQKSIYYNTPNRLTEKRLSRWREGERNLQYFLKQNQSNDSTRSRCSSTNLSQSKLSVHSRVPTDHHLSHRSQITSRPFTAVMTDTKKVEQPTRPFSSCATQSVKYQKDNILQDTRMQVVNDRFPMMRYFESCEIDTVRDILSSCGSDTDKVEQIKEYWQSKKNENATGTHSKSLQVNNFFDMQHTRDGRASCATDDKISACQIDRHNSEPSHLSNVSLKTKQIITPQNKYALQRAQTVFRQSLMVTKSRRKRMLDELVDHSSPNEKETIRLEILKLCKLEQYILTKATHSFCVRIDSYNKCDKSNVGVQ